MDDNAKLLLYFSELSECCHCDRMRDIDNAIDLLLSLKKSTMGNTQTTKKINYKRSKPKSIPQAKVFIVDRIVRVVSDNPFMVEVSWEGYPRKKDNRIITRDHFVHKKVFERLLRDYYRRLNIIK